jgi:hypothetical protein
LNGWILFGIERQREGKMNKQDFIDAMMQFAEDYLGGDAIPSTEASFAEVFDDVIVKLNLNTKKAIDQAIFGILGEDSECKIFGLYGVLKELQVTPSDMISAAEAEEYEIEEWQVSEYKEFLNYKDLSD